MYDGVRGDAFVTQISQNDVLDVAKLFVVKTTHSSPPGAMRVSAEKQSEGTTSQFPGAC